jgi:hypothetical protein
VIVHYIIIFPRAVVDVGFESAEYTVIEGDGEIEICGVLLGHQDIPISVTFSILDPPSEDQSKPGRYLPCGMQTDV